ncbi:hypothetical protein AB0I60_04800 [Actinosynnema sp. NPDC050436]|uniref:hypothetical protein n=1 Tax=Actinosynnema sp. NPDC050436 TaxID=3155659 RepID=UPI0034008C8E
MVYDQQGSLYVWRHYDRDTGRMRVLFPHDRVSTEAGELPLLRISVDDSMSMAELEGSRGPHGFSAVGNLRDGIALFVPGHRWNLRTDRSGGEQRLVLDIVREGRTTDTKLIVSLSE